MINRVLFVQGGFSSIGGIEVFAADLLAECQARRTQTELICWNAEPNGKNQLLTQLAQSGVKLYQSGWRWGCRWGWPDRWMAFRFWQTMMGAEVLVFGKMLHDSIHRRLAQAKKRAILITPYRPSEMWKDRRPENWILNSFETIIVQAPSFETDLRKIGYTGRVVTLPYLPPETQRPIAWPATPTLQIGFLGRLVPDKNLEYLIRSFSHLREMGVESHLHLFGDGSERDALKSLSNRLKLAEHIEFHGQLGRSEIPAAIDGCHLFAFSSRTEGQCLAALEILARGRPVLGTPVGAFPEFLSGFLGSVAPLDDPTVFATALKALAGPVLNGEITSMDVQRAYKLRFPRSEVIDEYIRILGCSGSTQKRKQVV
jgi:glycosyltransferase involved in cell wall biosynthesis